MELIRPQADVRGIVLSFQTAPMYDLVFSLAAATNPGKYEMPHAWARDVRSSLPAAQRHDLRYFFGDPSPIGTGVVQVAPDVGSVEAAPFVLFLEAMEPVDFVTALLCRPYDNRALRAAIRRSARGRAGEDDTVRVRAHLSTVKLATRKRFLEILSSPQDAHTRYIALLRAHYEGWFVERYDEVQPFLEQRAKQGRRSIGKLPTEEVIARTTGGFTLRTPTAKSVTLVPSYYTAPFVVVVRDGKDTVLVYGARPREEVGHRTLDGQMVKVLKALADETRLSILQLLAQRPLYGQQIAEALGLSHPTVSHHMAQLRIAGLTRTELTEDGNKVYCVRPETVQALSDGLRVAFVEPQSDRSDG